MNKQKKTYQSPELRVFGTLAEATLAGGYGAKNDGGIPQTGKDKS